MNSLPFETNIMTRLNILSCCALAILAGALVYKNRELSELRGQARQLLTPAVIQGDFAGLASKPNGERPAERADEVMEVEFQAEEDSDGLEQMTVFEESGELSKAAIDKLKLTADEAAAMGKAVQGFRSQVVEELASRMKPKAPLPDEGPGLQYYYARARRDRGQSSFDSLALEFGSVVGQDRARRLVGRLADEDLFATLCKNDLDVQVIPPMKEDEEVMVRYQIRNPRDGDFSLSSGSTLAEFEEVFGKLGKEEGGRAE
ncbi:MAG: hypothetical protein EOP83_07005 [Verrucomicrobiaceae bacterium]|nr:MAG: hypothetical protein EOP83_07005 [Verrucomicrobiaceae bacterium]